MTSAFIVIYDLGRKMKKTGGDMMLLGLNVTDTVYYTGGACYLIAFFSNVWAHLEKGKKGSRFPFLMNELYEGVLSYEHVLQAISELAQIEAELKKLPSSYYIYDYLEPYKQKPDGMKVNEGAVSLYDSLINDDGKTIISVIQRALSSAHYEKELVWIGNPLDEKSKPKLDLDAEKFVYAEENGFLALDRYFGNIERVVVPEYKGGIPVRKIMDRAFLRNQSLKEIILPKYVNVIEEGCFRDCSALEHVTFGDCLVRIGSKAFQNCISLVYINLPQYLQVIEAKAFFGCSSLEEVHLQDGVENIEDEAFAECAHLTKVVLPASVRRISDTAFHKSRKNLTIIAPLGTIGSNYAKKRRIKWLSTDTE